jgi:ATP-dependent helicase HrpA
MVLEADRNGCAREVMVIVAALSIQDPRERPAEKQQAADEKHARFRDPGSDFLTYLNLWQYLREQQQELSSGQFRRQCKAEFLNHLRIREWQDIDSQLRQVARSMGITPNTTPADPQKIHTSLLVGLLSHIGLMEPDKKREYVGARGTRFAIFPGSVLFKKPPRWVMSAELVETSRLWARINAKIEPEWVEPLAQHLVKRSYSEPHWEKKQGAVMALETVTLYGVPIVASRKVNYGRIDPELSRELFIRHALVEGDWETHHEFFHENRKLLGEVEELEHRARRRDIMVDDETLFDFYDERIAAEVVSGRHFDSWWKTTRREQPDLLGFEKSMLINDSADDVSERDFPDLWKQGELTLDLTYQFEPGADADGVTVHIPLPVLNQVSPDGFDWQIPGLRLELVTALIRALPKNLRRNFVPAPDWAKALLARVKPRTVPLLDALEGELRRLTGVLVSRDSWQLDQVPDHLKITFRVLGPKNRVLGEDKDLGVLKQRLAPQQRATLVRATGDLERTGLRTWDFGTLPQTVAQGRLKGYPALTDEGDSTAIRMYGTEAEQRQAMWRGTRRLVLLNAASPVRQIQGRLTNQAKLALSHNPHGSVAALFEDCVACAADKLITENGGPVWDQEAFAKLYDTVRAELHDTTVVIVGRVERILKTAHAIDLRLKSTSSPSLIPALTDIRAQLSRLIHPGFVTATGWRRLPDLVRYLTAIERRLDKLPDDPHRDRDRMLAAQQLQASYEQLNGKVRPGEALEQIRWMLEELRVSYFAQALGTPYPVSDKRILKAMDQLRP